MSLPIRDWRDGWDRGRKSPHLLTHDGRPRPTPEFGPWSGDRWRDLAIGRRQTVRALVLAGYLARRTWDRADCQCRRSKMAYTSGRAIGEPAIDPWTIAERVGACTETWAAALRVGSYGVGAFRTPLRCGMRHLCPVCASRWSASLAGAMRSIVGSGADGGGELALVTLTHRDSQAEDLRDALARMRASWTRATHAGSAWYDFKRIFAGWYTGWEVTRNTQGGWWHVHIHVIVSLTAGVTEAEARAWLAARWTEATAHVAAERGLPSYGWDERAGLRADGSIGWWEAIDRAEPLQVYQAAKYPCPIASLEGLDLAEYLAVSWGRRWHQGGGTLRSVIRMAEAIDAQEEVDGTGEADRLDLGDLVSSSVPGGAPIVRTLGRGDHPIAPMDAAKSARWSLASRATWVHDLLRAAGMHVRHEADGRTWVFCDRETWLQCLKTGDRVLLQRSAKIVRCNTP